VYVQGGSTAESACVPFYLFVVEKENGKWKK